MKNEILKVNNQVAKVEFSKRIENGINDIKKFGTNKNTSQAQRLVQKQFDATGLSFDLSGLQMFGAALMENYKIGSIKQKLSIAKKYINFKGGNITSEQYKDTIKAIENTFKNKARNTTNTTGQTTELSKQAQNITIEVLHSALGKINADTDKRINENDKLKFKAILLTQFFGCLRISELCNLTINDLSIDKDGIIINLAAHTTKTGEAAKKFIPVNSIAYKFLIEHIRINNPTTFLFTSKENKQMYKMKVTRIIKKYVGKEFSTHSQRAGAITTALKNGATINEAQKLSGHKTAQMILHYNRNNDIKKDNAVSKLM